MNEWLDSCPEEGAPSNHSVGGWVGERVGLDAMAKRKIPWPTGNKR
jgi:hypothetical protein